MNDNVYYNFSEEVIKTYLRRRKNDLEILRSALADNNLEPFKLIGHQIKGNALMFGFEDLDLIGKALDKAGHLSCLKSAQDEFSKFESWVNKNCLIDK